MLAHAQAADRTPIHREPRVLLLITDMISCNHTKRMPAGQRDPRPAAGRCVRPEERWQPGPPLRHEPHELPGVLRRRP